MAEGEGGALAEGAAPGLGEPPSLGEPLVRLNSSGIQSAIAWVYNVVTSLVANIEAERDRQSLAENELRSEDRQLRERIERLEISVDTSPNSPTRRSNTASLAGADQVQNVDAVAEQAMRLEDAVGDISKRLASLETGMGPADGTAANAYSSELKQYADRTQHLERQLENFREQLAQRLEAQAELAAMRLETIERELLACLRSADLDSLRSQVDENCTRLQRDMPERVRSLGMELSGEFSKHTENLQKDLKAVNDLINAKLEIFDEQLEAIAASGGGGASGYGGGEGAGNSAAIAVATGKINREIVDLEARVKDVEVLRDQNLDSRVSELERQTAESGSHAPEALGEAASSELEVFRNQNLNERVTELEKQSAQVVPLERRVSHENIDIDGSQLFAGMGDELTEGIRTDRELQLDVAPRELQLEEGQDFAELSSRVECMSNRLFDMEQQVAAKVAVDALSPDPRGDGTSAVPDLARLTELAEHVDTSLADMSRRLATLEEGDFVRGAAGEQSLSAEEAKRLAAEAAAEAAGAPSSLFSELSSRMDTTLGDVSQRIGNLEQQVGAMHELPGNTAELAGMLAAPAKVADAGPEMAQRLTEVERRLGESAPAELAERLAEVERRLGESPTQQKDVPNGLPPNILESLQHELESAKARIELQLGQDLEAKIAGVEQRLAEQIGGGGPSSAAVEVLQGRMTDAEGNLKALKASVDAAAAAAAAAAASTSRDLRGPSPVSPDEFGALSQKVGVLEQKLVASAAAAAAASAAAAAAASAANSAPAASESAERDKEQEGRMTAMWTELAGHAEAAAVRADALERGLLSRIKNVETTVGTTLQSTLQGSAASKKATDSEMKKAIEWINWRISWLEWATNGEKRSFGRAIDSKAVCPSPPPGTIAATAFNQPMMEDMELWAREPGPHGRSRLRRELNGPPPGFSEAPLSATAPLMMRGSASLGRLPSLRQ